MTIRSCSVAYKTGPLGVIKEGAYADILLVDGNPLEDLSILGDDGKNIPLIMKDGTIYKNTLHGHPSVQ